jgi:hypothetical protein
MSIQKPKLSVLGERILYRVEIVGRGGDSVHDEYFLTREHAILASAVDGHDHPPYTICVLELSDGSFVQMKRIGVSLPPSEEEIEKLLENLTPAQKILFERLKR